MSHPDSVSGRMSLQNYDSMDIPTLYGFVCAYTSSEPNPITASLKMDEMVAEFVKYCQDYRQVKEDYDLYESTGFDPMDPAMFLKNIQALDIIREHIASKKLPSDISAISAAYRKDLEERYRDSLIAAALNILKERVPAEEHVKLDIANLNEAMRQLDQHLAHYLELLEVLQANDRAIYAAVDAEPPAKAKKDLLAELSKVAKLQVSRADMQREEIHRGALLELLKQKYAAVALMHNSKFSKLLAEQLEKQHAILEQLDGGAQPPPPSMPTTMISGQELKRHLDKLNRELYTQRKVILDTHTVESNIEKIKHEREAIMAEHKANLRKNAKLMTKVTHLFSDMPEATEVLAKDIRAGLQDTLEQVEACAKATSDMIHAIPASAAEQMKPITESCNKVVEEASAIKDDLHDIHSTFYTDPVSAVMKVIELGRNLYDNYRVVCDKVEEHRSWASQKFEQAKQKVAPLINFIVEAISMLVDKVTRLIQNTSAMQSFFKKSELKTTKIREERKAAAKPKPKRGGRVNWEI